MPLADAERQIELAMAQERYEDAALMAVRLCAEGSPEPGSAQQARLWLMAAHALRVVGRFATAYDHALHAARRCRERGDREGESSALSALAHAASVIGRADEAIEAASIAVALVRDRPPGPALVTAHNYLGVAFLWNQQWDEAHVALEAAVRAAERCVPPESPVQPWLNRLLAEAHRAMVVRCLGDDEQARMTAQNFGSVADALGRSAQWQAMRPGSSRVAQALWAGCTGVRDALLGDFDAAEQRLAQGRALLAEVGIGLRNQHVAMLDVVAIHLLWSRRDWDAALRGCQQLLIRTRELGHARMLSLAWMMSGRLHELAGEPEAALTALRQLRIHEVRMQAGSLSQARQHAEWLVAQRPPVAPAPASAPAEGMPGEVAPLLRGAMILHTPLGGAQDQDGQRGRAASAPAAASATEGSPSGAMDCTPDSAGDGSVPSA